MGLSSYIFEMILILLIPVSIFTYLKRDWVISHVIFPTDILYLGTASERSQVGAQAFLAFIRRPVTWILLLIYIVVAALGCYGIEEQVVTLTSKLPVNNAIKQFASISFMVIPTSLPCFLLFWHGRRWMCIYIRTYLNENGMPICMCCGYDLRGQVSASCPECGTGLEQNQITSED